MSNLIAQPIAWAHHSTFNDLDNFNKSRFTATLSKKETNACCIPLFTNTQRTWVGLTDEDFLEACQIAERGNYLVAFQRIQAKLRSKNNG